MKSIIFESEIRYLKKNYTVVSLILLFECSRKYNIHILYTFNILVFRVTLDFRFP